MQKTVVLLGTSHPIQRGENAPNKFKSVLIEECKKHKINAIAEEMNKGINTVASNLATELQIGHLYADPDNLERVDKGIESDCRVGLVIKYGDKYPQINIWPYEPTIDNLPAEVWEEYNRITTQSDRIRESIWLDKIADFDKWPILFICGANHFREFFKLLSVSGYFVIESHEDWMPTN